MKLDLPIYSFGGFSHKVTDDLPNLRSKLAELTYRLPRQSDRLTQLSLLGLAACSGINLQSTESPLILASGDSNLNSTIQNLEQVFAETLTMSPIGFINSVSNSTAFFLNQALGNLGQTITVSRDECSLEAAFQMANTLQHDTTQLLYVGTVDEVSSTPDIHKKRMKLPPGAEIGEGSHWFVCGARREGINPIGCIKYVSALWENAQIAELMEKYCISHTVLTDTVDHNRFNTTDLRGERLAIPSPGYYATQNGYLLAAALEATGKGDSLCLLNQKRRSTAISVMIIDRR